MRGRYHFWTLPQIRMIGELWRENLSCEAIADRICDAYGIAVGKNSIVGLARRHRDLMPVKTRAQLNALRREGAIRRARRSADTLRQQVRA